MASTGADKRWIQLSNAPKTQYPVHISKLNHHEVIFTTTFNDEDIDGIHKYNIHTNEWKHIMKYPKDEQLDGLQIETMAIGQTANKTKIYLGEYNNDQLLLFS